MLSLANYMMRFKVLSFGAGCFDGVVCGIGDVCMLIKPLKKDCVSTLFSIARLSINVEGAFLVCQTQ